jgi:hypothetical protein
MKSILRNILLWIVSLAILNTSIDVSDDYIEDISPDDSCAQEYNEIESLAELVMDETTDQTLPDQKGNDPQGMIKKSAGFDFAIEVKRQRIICNVSFIAGAKYTGDSYTLHLSPGFRTIFSPPPNIAA